MNLRFDRRERGFTLIELLAAMTILTIMVLLISRIFADSTKIWQVGSKRVESNTDGRAVVDFMVRELSGTLCDGPAGPLALILDSDFKSVLGLNPDQIFFVTADKTVERSPPERQVMEVTYTLTEMDDSSGAPIPNRYRIVRKMVKDSTSAQFTCYKGGYPRGKPVLAGTQTLVENVRTLEFWVYDTNGVQHTDYDSTSSGPPGWIEVYLELLGNDNSIKASLMGATANDYCNRNVRRYVGRAYLQANGGKQ